MQKKDIENIEIDLLLEAVFRRYGYDFRAYERSSIDRRIRKFFSESDCASISDMIPRLLKDKSFFAQMLGTLSITTTEMFRDPAVYLKIREKVIPFLKTYPFIRIWHAGCATGEEAYSLAILLLEEGLYERTTIFATDFNDEALAIAKEGIYPVDNIRQFTLNYQRAGGSESFSNYYHACYNSIAVSKSLKKNITFANHNLVTDGVFSEMHLILCRNVLIYFDRSLQNKVLSLFYESLIHGGFLCLGSAESLDFSDSKDSFIPISKKNRIFQKKLAV